MSKPSKKSDRSSKGSWFDFLPSLPWGQPSPKTDKSASGQNSSSSFNILGETTRHDTTNITNNYYNKTPNDNTPLYVLGGVAVAAVAAAAAVGVVAVHGGNDTQGDGSRSQENHTSSAQGHRDGTGNVQANVGATETVFFEARHVRMATSTTQQAPPERRQMPRQSRRRAHQELEGMLRSM